MTALADAFWPDALGREIIDLYQRDLPLVPRPYEQMADKLGVTEEAVLGALGRLIAAGAVSRVGAVVEPHKAGWSTLAAMEVPEVELEEVAALVSAYPEVNHNYEREHRLNLWFVVTAPHRRLVKEVLEEIASRTGLQVIDLPLEERFRLDLGIRLAMELSPVDQRVLGAIQDGLPLMSCPFAEIGERLSLDESFVLERLEAMVEEGVVRRLGVIVRHRELGYSANAMTVWDVPDELVRTAASHLVSLPFVTLCYRRPRRPPIWPYNLFVMIHGRDREVVQRQIEEATVRAALTGLPRAVLFSRRRFKQRGARYASEPIWGA